MDDVLSVHLNGFLYTTVALIDLDAEFVLSQVLQHFLRIQIHVGIEFLVDVVHE